MMVGILLLFSIVMVSAAKESQRADICVTPEDELAIEKDTTLCPGRYRVSGIRIEADNLTLDCNGA